MTAPTPPTNRKDTLNSNGPQTADQVNGKDVTNLTSRSMKEK